MIKNLEKNTINMGDIQGLFDSGELYERIENGKFDGINVGSFFKKEWKEWIDTIITFRIAGFDLYDLDRHHLVIVPDEELALSCMNETMTTETGYFGSYMNKRVIGDVATSGGDNTINQRLYNIFGEHLLTTKEYLSVDNQGNFEYFDCQAVLIPEYEIFGKNKCSKDGNVDKQEQLPLFKISPEYIPMGYWWWFRDVASSECFCDCCGDGSSAYANASAHDGVRPRFVIG